MAVTQTTRLDVTRWSAGPDPLTRAQMDLSHQRLEERAAGFLRGTIAARPAAGAANQGFLYEATDQGNRLYWSTGAAWVDTGPVVALGQSMTTTTVVNTAVETNLLAPSIAGGALAAGSMLRLTAIGDRINGSGATVKWTWRAKFGATTVLDTTLVSVSSGARSWWRLDLALFAESTTAQRVGAMLFISTEAGATTWPTGFHINEGSHIGYGVAAENTATAKTLALTVQHDAAVASADTRIHAWMLEHVRAA